MRRQDTAQAASILAGFKIDDLAWTDEEDYLPHWKSCRHWPVTATSLQEKLNEFMLDILRGVRCPRKSLEIEFDIGCACVPCTPACGALTSEQSPHKLQRLPEASDPEFAETGYRAFNDTLKLSVINDKSTV